MEIKINKEDADYIWKNFLKDSEPLLANDECWYGDDLFYTIYQYDELVVMAIYDVLDGSAEMDTNDFVDWDNPAQLNIISDKTPADYQ